MKKINFTTCMLALILISFTTISCVDNKKSEKDFPKVEMKESNEHNHKHGDETNSNEDMDHSKMNSTDNSMQKSPKSSLIVTSYLQLKNALVADDSQEAATAGKVLNRALIGFDISGYSKEDQKELTDIIEDASEHAEHISKSSIDHQREHLVTLSVDLVDLIAIVGSQKTLYQDYCPMANDNNGAIWISDTKEIKNPYFGSKMLTCGSVQKEI